MRGQNIPKETVTFTCTTRVSYSQVEMAHKLTSALFKDENKKSKGQQMYMNRAQNAGISLF